MAALGQRCVVIEKTLQVGGVWALNDYPGLTLKTPGVAYRCMSVAPSWQKKPGMTLDELKLYHPTGREILEYIQELSEHPLITLVFNTEHVRTTNAGEFLNAAGGAAPIKKIECRRDGRTLHLTCKAIVMATSSSNDIVSGRPHMPIDVSKISNGAVVMHSADMSANMQRFAKSKTKYIVGSHQAAVEVLRQCDPSEDVVWLHRGHHYFMKHEVLVRVMLSPTAPSAAVRVVAAVTGWLDTRGCFAVSHRILSLLGAYTTVGAPMSARPWFRGGVMTDADRRHLLQFRQQLIDRFEVDDVAGTLVFHRAGRTPITAQRQDAVVMCTGQRTERKDVYAWEGRLEGGVFDPPFMTPMGGRVVLITYLLLAYLQGSSSAYSDGSVQRELERICRQKQRFVPETCTPGSVLAWMTANRGFEQLIFPGSSQQIAFHSCWHTEWFAENLDPRHVFRACEGRVEPVSWRERLRRLDVVLCCASACAALAALWCWQGGVAGSSVAR